MTAYEMRISDWSSDVCSSDLQRPIDRLLVLQRQPLGRQGQQRRAAAGDEAQHQIVLSQALDQLQDARRGVAAGRVGHRMRGLDDGAALARDGMAVRPEERRVGKEGDRTVRYRRLPKY